MISLFALLSAIPASIALPELVKRGVIATANDNIAGYRCPNPSQCAVGTRRSQGDRFEVACRNANGYLPISVVQRLLTNFNMQRLGTGHSESLVSKREVDLPWSTFRMLTVRLSKLGGVDSVGVRELG
jgi:hypothetical protein